MLEEIEAKKEEVLHHPWRRLKGPPEGRFSKVVQVLQAVILGWCAGAFLGLPSPWASGLLPFLAILIWFGDATRARYPSAMLLAFAAGALRLLWRPMVDGAGWGPALPYEDIIRWGLLCAALLFTGYGDGRPPREFFAGPKHLAWLRRGLLLALATAVGFQLTGLWRLGTRLGLGTPEDDILFGAVSAILVAAGGLAFGRLFKRPDEVRVALALGASSLMSFAALAIVGGISTPRGFRALCERFGADASLAGTALVDTAVACSIGVLPLFALGTAIHLARDRGALATLILGLSFGPALASEVLPTSIESIAEAAQAIGSAALPKLGAIAAGILLVLMVWAGTGTGRARYWVGAGGLVLTALGALVPVSPLPILQPWNRFPRQPEAVFETTAGQFTIQTNRNGHLQVLLDQRPLLPGPEEAELDRKAILESYHAWESDPERTSDRKKTSADAGPPVWVLVVGLITPERAEVLTELGITRFFRLTTFPNVAPHLERRLFEAAGLTPSEIPEGEHVHPFDSSFGGQTAFDLTFIFTPGAHAALDWEPQSLGGPPSASGYSARRNWADQDRPLVGITRTTEGFVTDGLRAFAADLAPGVRLVERFSLSEDWEPAREGPTVIEWLKVRPDERPREALRWILRRMPPPSGHELFHQGFVEFAEIQRVGSPFESADERVILNERALSLWREFAIAQTEFLSHERSMLEGAADALQAQGEIEWILEFLQPIASAHAPWAKLDGAVQWASDQSRPAGRLGIVGIMSQLTQLLTQAEGATIGVITGVEVRQVDPGDGAPLMLTGLTVRGTDLATWNPSEVQVWYPGGVIDENTGSFTADSPKRHQTRIGRGAAVFHRHSDNMGGGLSGNVLVGGAAGLLNTFTTSDSRSLVLRHGGPRKRQDRASGGNISVEELRSRFRALSGSPPNPPR